MSTTENTDNKAKENSVNLMTLGELLSGAGSILWEASSKQTADTAQPEREVAGVKLQLGGKENATAAEVKAGRFFSIKNAFRLLFESVTLFFRKLYWVATKPDSPGIQNIVNDMRGGKPLSATA